MKDSESSDFAQIPTDIRRNLHRTLYRQECRAFLLAIGLVLGIILLTNPNATMWPESAKGTVEWMAGAIVVFLAFWVVYPSQKILAQLRKAAKPEDGNLESKFDDSWQSVWDFGPPLLLPVGLWLALVVMGLAKVM